MLCGIIFTIFLVSLLIHIAITYSETPEFKAGDELIMAINREYWEPTSLYKYKVLEVGQKKYRLYCYITKREETKYFSIIDNTYEKVK